MEIKENINNLSKGNYAEEGKQRVADLYLFEFSYVRLLKKIKK